MSQPDLERFFADYVEAFNRSLGAEVDADAITGAFSDCFISASPSGVACGKNDAEFRKVLDEGYAFYKSIGTRRMHVRGVDVTPIDELHHMATVNYSVDYQKKTGEAVSIDFDVTYLLQTLPSKPPKIFAFISGDEMALYRQHGLVDQ